MTVSIGWSDFAVQRHTPESGNSYSTMSSAAVVERVKACWHDRFPGQGEINLERKVVVPIRHYLGEFVQPLVNIMEGLPVFAEVIKRQEGEKPFVETYALMKDVKELGIGLIGPIYVRIVCYSAEALLANGGKRSTDCDWEIVAILASQFVEEPMTPLTMARNFLEKEGGTKSDYTAEEFAEAIWHHSINRGIKVRNRKL